MGSNLLGSQRRPASGTAAPLGGTDCHAHCFEHTGTLAEKKGWVRKRRRRSLKDQRDEVQFRKGRRILAAFHEREVVGEIDVFDFDETGLSSCSCVPYAWQRRGETRALPANVPGRLNVIGLMNRDHQGYFQTVEGTVTYATVIETISAFIRRRPPEKLTFVVIDNASEDEKAVKQAQWA